MSASIHIERASKVYDGAVRAVDRIDMDIREGEFFALLGPSGCGKTTTLRMIAGFEQPTEGTIRVSGKDVTGVPAHKRDMGMVFQNYALFPHRTVRENVGFGLRMRGIDKATVARKVDRALEMVSLSAMGERRPAQLSGGQQQRVALARAIVIEPRVLLCDEPLGALDKKLRQQMQFELKELQKTLGVTTVFVTHDQEEAMAMSDRIAIMNGGRVEQIGTPSEIYNRPKTRFAADFIGDTNLLSGKVVERDGGKVLVVAEDGFEIPGADHHPGGVVHAALRPEKIVLHPDESDAPCIVRGRIDSANFLGDSILYRIALPKGRHVLARAANTAHSRMLPPGAMTRLDWQPSDLVFLAD
ncbi:ABC transporter ATP-binding protein [Salipiger sp. P9]|uniref:ABC transporter ATP-binding protein n=1 Tax=Salipiger pentaromativorans TaxID=2943193 RepID=UPI002157F3D3|nr:ABC transporter ATP-binding protein [Salipiger pentaromativorans]MCR8546914.1 ABC transporter ATP-binding protein [Salipiger pentaromativorans]